MDYEFDQNLGGLMITHCWADIACVGARNRTPATPSVFLTTNDSNKSGNRLSLKDNSRRHHKSTPIPWSLGNEKWRNVAASQLGVMGVTAGWCGRRHAAWLSSRKVLASRQGGLCPSLTTPKHAKRMAV
jgi:hypothetical protein